MIERKTIFSPCRRYRYTLWREWSEDLLTGCADESKDLDSYAMFIGLNPSTADETKDDPTIRRCIQFAKDWGYGALCMTNLFAWRETDSSKLRSVPELVGKDNDQYLSDCASRAGIVIAAWGAKGSLLGRSVQVRKLIPNLHALRITKGGFPAHPLYLPGTLRPIKYPDYP